MQNGMDKSSKTTEASILLIPCCVKERGFETITGPLDNWMSLPSVWPELSMGFCNADIMLLSTGSRKFDGRIHFVDRAISANQTTSEHKKRSIVGFIRYPILALTQLTPIQANTSPPTFRLGWCAAQCAVHFQRYAKKVRRWFFFENPVQFTG